MMLFVFFIHLLQGFTYNVYFTYCLTRFPEFAATASGISSGGSYLIFSVVSYCIVHAIQVDDQLGLSLAYIICLVLIFVLLLQIKGVLRRKSPADLG